MSTDRVIATNLGYPRIGANRQLKRALEAYWRGEIGQAELRETGRRLRATHWQQQARQGIAHIPSNDFSYYDHVLDAAVLVGAVPRRFARDGEGVDLDTYFAMARGVQEKEVAPGRPAGSGQVAMEMTKWFDTNYHYIVPELHVDQTFRLASSAPADNFAEAKALGIHTRPVLLGPVSLLLLGKAPAGDVRPIELLDRLVPVYGEVLAQLEHAGADWVQIDEPCLGWDLDDEAVRGYARAYGELAPGSRLKILIATYFGGLRDNLRPALALPVAGLHLDLVRDPAQLEAAFDHVLPGFTLSLGLVDGRNVWRADLDVALSVVRRAMRRLGPERVIVGPSCSLLHVPVDLEAETELDAETRSWLAFAYQKLEEIVALARAAGTSARVDAASPGESDATDSSVQTATTDDAFRAGREAAMNRRSSQRIRSATVQARLASVTPDMLRRNADFPARRRAQRERLGLPHLPATTIGSFPQTPELRRARAALRRGELAEAEYDAVLEQEIDRAIRLQEDVGLDLLVHGEPERSDMVEYFAERLDGFLVTRNGWVQSYGSRCVRPPIIYGDVARPAPMTVRWTRYARSRTPRPVKAMLTGPITLLQWSFVRDDQPRAVTCRQIALAIRDEVEELADIGQAAIQIDEPALREGLPLRVREWDTYLEWAVSCFRIASSGVPDDIQIHTHMCYAEFGDIIDAIAAMDADVLSIESSRSGMETLTSFSQRAYPNDVGPGVYDIHSPRVPTREEILELLTRALRVISPDRLWVNPDCGLKTRRWEEVEPALRHMVDAARTARAALARDTPSPLVLTTDDQ